MEGPADTGAAAVLGARGARSVGPGARVNSWWRRSRAAVATGCWSFRRREQSRDRRENQKEISLGDAPRRFRRCFSEPGDLKGSARARGFKVWSARRWPAASLEEPRDLKGSAWAGGHKVWSARRWPAANLETPHDLKGSARAKGFKVWSARRWPAANLEKPHDLKGSARARSSKV